MPLLAFDDVVIDVENHRITKDGAPVELEPKSFRVLLYLMEHSGRVVPKDELLDQVWPGAAVTENALTRVVAQIRKALNDDSRQPKYIETVPTVGYRFVAEARQEEAKPARPVAATPERTINWWVPVGVLAAIAFSAVMPWLRQRAADPGRVLHASQFTSAAGLELHPSFSPDGSSVAFASDRTGRFEIYVRQTAGGNEIAITNDGKENLQPAWSPDGSQIAYYSAIERGIFVAPSLGGMPRRLTAFGSQPAWSPDGKRVVFRSEGLVSVAAAELPPATASALWTVAAEGGEPVALTKPNEPPGHHAEPVYSPDGTRVAFTSYHGLNGGSIWEVSTNTKNYWQATGADLVAYNPAYGADGLYYLVLVDRDSVGIYRKGGSGEARQLARYDFVLLRDLAVHGRRIGYVISGNNSNLWVLENGSMRALTDETYQRITQPVFSPDGARIAHLTRMTGNLSDIWLRNADGSNAVQLSRSSNADYMPSWLPDGRGIVYTAREGTRSVLRQFSLKDGTESVLAELGNVKSTGRLSPDAATLAYARAEGGVTNVWTVDVKTGKQRQVTFTKDWAAFPVWSRDGKQLAVEVREGEDVHLSIARLEDGTVRRVTARRGQTFPYSFSSDDRRVAVAANWDGPWNLYAVDVETGAATALTENRNLRVFYRYPDWSPDGRVLVFERNETRGDIFLGELPVE